MSTYTDKEHERALNQTLYWKAKTPATKEEAFEYAQYQYTLKDYKEAVVWYKKSAQEQYIPSLYQLAYCMRHQLGIGSDNDIETILFKQVIVHDENASDFVAKYRLGMCYTYGYGTDVDEQKGAFYFMQAKDEVSQALYEIGLFYKEGKGGLQANSKKAEEYLSKAYDGHCEQAMFTLFAMFTGDLKDFAYKREIKEAYAFKLGQFMRVAELRPCKEYLTRLADFYQQGFPGDTQEGLKKFKSLAKKYNKRASALFIM